MKTIDARIKALTLYQMLFLISIVLIWDGYLFMGWFGEFLRNGGNEWDAMWYGVPIAGVLFFADYKDRLEKP